jgi:hypothetical protein
VYTQEAQTLREKIPNTLKRSRGLKEEETKDSELLVFFFSFFMCACVGLGISSGYHYKTKAKYLMCIKVI